MLAHEEVWCQGFSEPNAGSDLLGLRTVAEPHEGGWRITGQKVWTSYAAYSKFCYLLARVADSGITMFVAEIDQSAVTVRPLRNLSGTSEFCEVFFDGAFVPAEHVVGPVGSGWAAARYALSCERSTSLAQRALLLVREFDKLAELVARVSSDRDWADSFVDAFVRSRVVESFVKRVQATVAGGEDVGALASMAKVTWSEAHQAQLGLLLKNAGPEFVFGRQGFGPWQRALLHSRAETIYGGTSEIQRNLIAKSLGLPSDRRA
jgi:alkylation response protein AidB-like acyl-CoA dehydrogenase